MPTLTIHNQQLAENIQKYIFMYTVNIKNEPKISFCVPYGPFAGRVWLGGRGRGCQVERGALVCFSERDNTFFITVSVKLLYLRFKIKFYPRANGAMRRSGRKPGARVTNSTQP